MTLESTLRLTIGIPVYNGESTITQTLECCAKLPHHLVQVVVSDNGSTDGTFLLAQSFSERYTHISVYRHQENQGVARNFKYLLDNCSTEYFMWLAADDVVADSLCLAEVDHLFQKFPQAIAVSPFAMVGEVGAEISDRGNQPLLGGRTMNTLRYLLRPGVNSRFYSIYRTERLRALFAGVLCDGNDYFGSDVVFSVAVLKEGEWPQAATFLLTRKPGVSADGWKLRKVYSRSLIGALFPSVKFIQRIVGMTPIFEKPHVLLVSILLYVRFMVGPLKHRLSKWMSLS